jgi:murein DD-endopeptidase MepM/ murein hydrolase activator NlpD
MSQKARWFVIQGMVTLLFLLFFNIRYNKGYAEVEHQPEVVDQKGNCSNLDSLPIAQLQQDLVKPLMGETEGWRLSQRYNTLTPAQEPWPGALAAGHNGADVGGEHRGWADGKEEIKNVLHGRVIISTNINGWGNSIAVASRVNNYSDEILTTHYHHLNKRFVKHCEEVNPGQLIGMEGKTGRLDYDPHLHFTIRRWANKDHLLGWLNNGAQGPFYVFGGDAYFGHNGIEFKGSNQAPYGDHNTSEIQESSPYYDYGHIDPEPLLFNFYRDYDSLEGNSWSYTHARRLRHLGIEFGLWNGDFGISKSVKRREAARWLKIAAGLPNITNISPTFEDVTVEDPDFPYVEKLARHPDGVPAKNTVVNGQNSCTPNGKNFCPHNNITRAEALKMFIMTFYADEFLQKYSTTLSTAIYHKTFINTFFSDVNLDDWFLVYVWFGAQKEFVSYQTNFRPADLVTREEMAKWVIQGYEKLNGPVPDLCKDVHCTQSDEHCNPDTGNCTPNPPCIPSENNPCEQGGGPVECENPDCNPGETKSQDCGTGGTQTASCTDECAWSAWGDCEGSGSCEPAQTLGCGNCGTMTCQADGQWGACETQGTCTPGETQQQSCDGSGTQVRSCNGVCMWDSWGVCQNGCTCAGGECCDGCNYISSSNSCDLSYEFQCEGSSPGQNVQRRQVLQYCSGVDAGCSGSFDYGSWQTWEDCSSSQECEYVSGTPECVGSCQDVYLASSSSACFDNPQGSGNPTLCLYVQQNSGSSWEYQICKNGGAFQQDFTYRLKDDNHGVNYTQYSASAGTQCTPWRTFTVNQINAYGALNGAGLNGYVASPAGCSQAACQYNTGGITIRLECQ